MLFSLVIFVSLAASTALSSRRVDVEQGAEFGFDFLYTNIVQETRGWAPASGTGSTPLDSSGWPLADCMTVVFDDRPFPEWQCMSDPTACVDDPWVWGVPSFGTYFFSLQGKATVSVGNDPASRVVLDNSTFDPATYTTSGFFTIPPGAAALAILSFVDTQRSAASAPGSGFAGLRILRPGHAGDADRVWSPELLAMVAVVDHVRFMGITGTNTQAGFYGDAGHHALEWTDRCLPSDAQWPNALRPGCWGLPWEDVVSVAQATGKGVWVNLPISATCSLMPDGSANKSSYAYQWASLMKHGNAATGSKGLPAGVPVYVEHSNEVWNFGFSQYIYNKLAAMDECNATTHATPCLWANDGSKDTEVWARRRHAGKVFELSRTFAEVFGEDQVPSVVRPVYAEWAIFPQHYNATMVWFEATYGAPSKFMFAFGTTGYFGGDDKGTNMTLDAIYEDYTNSTLNQAAYRATMNSMAAAWGVKVVAYEAGPGWSVGKTANVGEYILAQRFAPMRAITLGDVAGWAAGGAQMAAYNHFSASGRPSRYGMWGHVETFFNQSTPKWCAVIDATGAPEPAGCMGW